MFLPPKVAANGRHNLGQNTHRITSQKRDQTEKWVGPVLFCLFMFLYVFLTIMNPKTDKTVRFNSYLTEYQTELLSRLSRERNCPKTELLREALHYFLRNNGLDDGLSYDRKDDKKRMAEISPWWRKEEEEEDMDPGELRRLLIEQMK